MNSARSVPHNAFMHSRNFHIGSFFGITSCSIFYLRFECKHSDICTCRILIEKRRRPRKSIKRLTTRGVTVSATSSSSSTPQDSWCESHLANTYGHMLFVDNGWERSAARHREASSTFFFFTTYAPSYSRVRASVV